jgi:hypothetical protein
VCLPSYLSPLVVRGTGRAHARDFPQTKGRPIEPGRGVMDESRSLTRKEPMDVLVYRTRVPADLWYNLHERAALLARRRKCLLTPRGCVLPKVVEAKGFVTPDPPSTSDLATPPLPQAAPRGIPRPPASIAPYPASSPDRPPSSSGPEALNPASKGKGKVPRAPTKPTARVRLRAGGNMNALRRRSPRPWPPSLRQASRTLEPQAQPRDRPEAARARRGRDQDHVRQHYTEEVSLAEALLLSRSAVYSELGTGENLINPNKGR